MAGVRRFLYLDWLIDFLVLVLAEQFTNGNTVDPKHPCGKCCIFLAYRFAPEASQSRAPHPLPTGPPASQG